MPVPVIKMATAMPSAQCRTMASDRPRLDSRENQPLFLI